MLIREIVPVSVYTPCLFTFLEKLFDMDVRLSKYPPYDCLMKLALNLVQCVRSSIYTRICVDRVGVSSVCRPLTHIPLLYNFFFQLSENQFLLVNLNVEIVLWVEFHISH